MIVRIGFKCVVVVSACLGALSSCAMAPPQEPAADPPAAPATALGSYLAAMHAERMFDYGEASKMMSRALGDDPNNFELMRSALQLDISDGRVAEALPLARRVFDVERNSAPAGLLLLVEDIRAGNFDAATALADSLPNEGPQLLAVPLLRAWAEAGRHRPAPALQALQPLAALRGFDPLRQLHAALINDFAGRPDDAEGAYLKLVADAQRPDPRIIEIAGNFLERRSRADAARRLYKLLGDSEDRAEIVQPALQRLDKGTPPAPIVGSAAQGAAQALFDLASLLLIQRETLEPALIFARLALYLDPKLALAEILVGDILVGEQRGEDGLAMYKAVDPKSPRYWSARLRAAATLDELKRTDEAVAQLEQIAGEFPDRAQPFIEMGDILRGRERFPEAVAAYDKAIQRVTNVEPTDWRLFYSRGVALERSNQWPRAEGDLQRALDLQPEQPLVLNYLGYSWIDKGQNLEKALKMVERAVELRPNDGYIVDSLGWAHYRVGNFQKATELLEHATELQPEDPTINDHLGDAYWRTGRLNEARFQWRRALQFKPEAAEVNRIEAKIENGLDKVASKNGG